MESKKMEIKEALLKLLKSKGVTEFEYRTKLEAINFLATYVMWTAGYIERAYALNKLLNEDNMTDEEWNSYLIKYWTVFVGNELN